MLNWNIIPMTYNDSFTYMEWLGKLNYVAENHEERIDAAEKEIIDLWEKVNNHEERIGTLETWRTDVVDPFIEDMTVRVGAIETWRENTVDPFIIDITNWKDNTVDPFITDIGNWKDNTVDPFITDIGTWKNDTVDPFITDVGPRVTSAEQDIDQLQDDLAAEKASRETTTGAISEKLAQVKDTADGALRGVEVINEQLANMGGIRYYMVDLVSEATITTSGSDKKIVFPLPDDDFGIIDVRGHYSTTEFRVTTNVLGTLVTTDTYTVQVKAPVQDEDPYTVELVLVGGASDTLDRLDYILYRAALKPGEQSQADIDFFNKMDTNGNGRVDAVDASQALAFYAYASTIQPDDPAYTLRGQELWNYWVTNESPGAVIDAYPDFTGDGMVNAVDASQLLAYYAWLSTTDTGSMTGPECMRAFRNRQ